MLSIRTGILSDVALLRTLIQEFATFERLPVAITEEQLMFNVLDWNQNAIEFYQKIGATFLNDWKTVCLKNEALHNLASQIR